MKSADIVKGHEQFNGVMVTGALLVVEYVRADGSLVLTWIRGDEVASWRACGMADAASAEWGLELLNAPEEDDPDEV